MTKEDLKEIVKRIVGDVWYNRRSLNPVTEQTEEITEKVWEKVDEIQKEKREVERECNFYELALQLKEGLITEQEYNRELEENTEKYVVNYENSR